MPHALKGSDFVYNHPELRAKDFMDAIKDKTIKAIFCAIGGSDSVRILPYMDYDVIRNNPKIFMGYSDTTVSYFVMNKAGVVSYYGPTIMCEFGEYVMMIDYTENAVKNILFNNTDGYFVDSSDEWEGKILLLETSEDKPSPDYVLYYLRNLGAQGILNKINGIIVGKPKEEAFYEEYKEVYLTVLKEFNCEGLPIIYNVNIGHAIPNGILPLGIKYEINIEEKTIRFLESATAEICD